LIGGLILGALVLCSASILASRSLRSVSESLDGVARTELIQYELQDIERLLSDMETAARDYALTHVDSSLRPYEAARPQLPLELDRLDDLVAVTGIDRNGVDALAALARDRQQRAAQIIDNARRGDAAAVRFLLQRGEGHSNMDAARAVTSSMQTEERRQLTLRRASVARSRGLFVAVLWVSGAVAGVLLLLLLRVAVPERAARRFGSVMSPFAAEPAAIDPATLTAMEPLPPELAPLAALHNHTLSIARDGIEKTLAQCGAPIVGADGAVVGAILLFRDEPPSRAAVE
jgi:CHASE3 domain sensor protein